MNQSEWERNRLVTQFDRSPNRLTEPRLFVINGTQSNRMTPSSTGHPSVSPSRTVYHPIGLGPGQNEQPRFGESIGTSSTGTQLTGTGTHLVLIMRKLRSFLDLILSLCTTFSCRENLK